MQENSILSMLYKMWKEQGLQPKDKTLDILFEEVESMQLTDCEKINYLREKINYLRDKIYNKES